MHRTLVITVLVMSALHPVRGQEIDLFGAPSAERFAKLALSCVHREYPNKISHVLTGDADVLAPRALTPVFFGCFDWHSAVHAHWLLVRLCRHYPRAAFVQDARAALEKSFDPKRVAAEVTYMDVVGRIPFERPYGLAWLLQLCAELREWEDDQDAQRHAKTLAPLEALASKRLRDWFPKLTHPIRTGEHSQTAFAMGLILDWARSRKDGDMERLILQRSRDYYLKDVGWSLAFEPGGQDFLSPGLAEADLMRRVLSPEEFTSWLSAFLPALSPKVRPLALIPAVVTDKSDGKLAHLDGLNLSRAWMLEGVAQALPEDDERVPFLKILARNHLEAGLAAVTGEDYAGGHWLGSFAVYVVTKRGLPRP